jgi:hypothetical protein
VADSPRKPLENYGLSNPATDGLGLSAVKLRRILTARTAGGGVQFTAQPRTPLGGRVGIDIIRLPLPSKFPKYYHISWYLSWRGGVPSERGRQTPLKQSPLSNQNIHRLGPLPQIGEGDQLGEVKTNMSRINITHLFNSIKKML